MHCWPAVTAEILWGSGLAMDPADPELGFVDDI